MSFRHFTRRLFPQLALRRKPAREVGTNPASQFADKIQQDLEKVDWSQFETAYGVATKVPGYLLALYAPDRAVAMKASSDLWAGLCHQHAYVSSAALPALPFLLHALVYLDNKLKVELLDIFCGFAVCTVPNVPLPDWGQELRAALLAESARFHSLAHHQDNEVAEMAQQVCDELSIARQ